jgi:hypothetical protein
VLTGLASCGSLDTAVPQCWQCAPRTSRLCVGLGRSGRCAPARGFPLGLRVCSLDALRPCEGGVLELSGVFGGRFSLSRSAAFSSSKAKSRLLNSSIRASNVTISASFTQLAKRRANRIGSILSSSLHSQRSRAMA